MPAAGSSGLGLVLGGGGIVGVAWEIGILQGLTQEGVLDLGAVDVLVGTSAGSIVGASLLHGHSLDELMARELEGSREGEGALRPPADAAATGAVFQKWGGALDMTPELCREIAELAAKAASFGVDEWVESLARRLGSSDWPGRELRVVASNGRTGERDVFTASSGVPLLRAIAASCAVPGLFPPVVIDGTPYVDGNVWSSGSADVVLGSGVERVVFIGPLIGDRGIGLLGARSLERERALLAEAGIAVTAITPGDAYRAAGMQVMDASRRSEAAAIGLAEGEAAAALF